MPRPALLARISAAHAKVFRPAPRRPIMARGRGPGRPSERRSHAGLDAGDPADDLVADPLRGGVSRQPPGGLAHSRGADPPLWLCRMRAPGEAPRQRHGTARHRARRPGRHARLERLPPPGAFLRRLGHGRRAAHGEPQALHGADRLHHQPRRRPRAVRGPHLRRAGGADRRPADHGRACDRDDRRRAHACDRAAQRPLL